MRRAAQVAESNYQEVQMESRLARLESDVAHIQKDVADIKADMKSLRERVEAGFTDIRASIAQLSVAMEKAYGKAKVATIETRVWGWFRLAEYFCSWRGRSSGFEGSALLGVSASPGAAIRATKLAVRAPAGRGRSHRLVLPSPFAL
jgi:hypothetical protein